LALAYLAVRRGKIVDNTDRFTNTTFLIVIAHPDDEAMFMTPTIKRILDQKSNTIYLL
jgi:hypothetical protein